VERAALMHLLQILLPLRDNEGRPFPRADFARVRAELLERFGGVTAYLQAPAQGIWKDEAEGEVERDEIVVLEVMVDALQRDWWRRYCEDLRRRFRQDELVVRAIEMERL
jgi:hypothetical protein